MKWESLERAKGVVHLIGNMTIISDEAEVVDLLNRLRGNTETSVVSFVNAHAVNLAWQDSRFRASLLGSDLLLRDGVGVKWLLWLLGRRAGVNMNGTDFIPRIIRLYLGERIAVYGSQMCFARKAETAIRRMGGNVVAVCNGFRDPDYYVRSIKDSRPRLVILGMGMPRQEYLAQHIKKLLEWPVLTVNGGAIIDFLADRFPRAPRLFRRVGVGWLYRLCLEPGRLWRRYLIGNFLFLLRTLIAAVVCISMRSHAKGEFR